MRWVIVAHPDDEVIFAGGAMLARQDEPWTVVIATHDQASPRGIESIAARDQLRASGTQVDYRFLGHPDRRFGPCGGIDRPRLVAQLAALGVQPGERVYTHGPPGEYGHNAHKAVHAGVAEALGEAALLTAFSGDGEVLERIVDTSILAAKAQLFNAAYPSQSEVWRGLARMMIEVTTEERHHALSAQRTADAAAVDVLHPWAASASG